MGNGHVADSIVVAAADGADGEAVATRAGTTGEDDVLEERLDNYHSLDCLKKDA
jgi:hypothetical protein